MFSFDKLEYAFLRNFSDNLFINEVGCSKERMFGMVTVEHVIKYWASIKLDMTQL